MESAQKDLDMAKITQNIDNARRGDLKKEEEQLKADIVNAQARIEANKKLMAAYERKLAKLDAQIAQMTAGQENN